MIPSVERLLRWPYDLVLNPSGIVASASDYELGSIRARVRRVTSTVGAFVFNVLLYTLPLSLSQARDPSFLVPPSELVLLLGMVTTDATEAAAFTMTMVENSLLLLYASVLLFVTYHVSVRVTRNSGTWISSLELITLSTGIYLAIIFNLLLYGTKTLTVTGELLRGVQTEFIQLMIDLTGSTHTIVVASPINPDEITAAGRIVLVGLVVAVCYFGYVLYLGARRIHGLSRIESVAVLGGVAGAPVVYTAVALTLIEFTGLPPDLFAL